MKSIIFNLTVLMPCFLCAVFNIFAQQAEPDWQTLSQVKIEYFHWYSEREAAEPLAIKNYYRRGCLPIGESANFPIENSARQKEPEKFIYRIKIRNLSEKEIVSVVWRYESFNPLTKELAASLEFKSRVRIEPHRRKTVYGESFSPPTQTIDVNLLLLN